MKFKVPTVFIVRHGERLDHVDKSWQPDPSIAIWDPPITKQGCIQAERTGITIHEMIVNQNINLNDTSIVLYTSPFQRCVDTSMGIIKGLYKASSNHWKHQPILRMDLGLGEWMCEKFFDTVCPASQLLSRQQEKLARQQAQTYAILARDQKTTVPPFQMDYAYHNKVYTEFSFPETYTEMIQRFENTRTQCLHTTQQEIIIFITHAVGVNALLDGFRKHPTIPLESNYCSLSCVRHTSFVQENSDQSEEEEEDASEFLESIHTSTTFNNWYIELTMSDAHL